MNSKRIFIKLKLLAFGIFPIFFCNHLVSLENPPHDQFVIHAIPRCGTHYIERVVYLLTGKEIFTLNLSDEVLQHVKKTGQILRIYRPFFQDDLTFLKTKKYKVVALYRDPRDALISCLFYMRSFTGQGLKRDFLTVSSNFDHLSFDDQLTALINGREGTNSFLDYYKNRIGWALNPYCLGVKFESLVGEEGAGSNELKNQALVDIANYLNLELSSERLAFVLSQMYLSQEDVQEQEKIFKRGSIGNWKIFFKPKHRKLFKNRCAELLIQLGYEKDDQW